MRRLNGRSQRTPVVLPGPSPESSAIAPADPPMGKSEVTSPPLPQRGVLACHAQASGFPPPHRLTGTQGGAIVKERRYGSVCSGTLGRRSSWSVLRRAPAAPRGTTRLHWALLVRGSREARS